MWMSLFDGHRTQLVRDYRHDLVIGIDTEAMVRLPCNVYWHKFRRGNDAGATAWNGLFIDADLNAAARQANSLIGIGISFIMDADVMVQVEDPSQWYPLRRSYLVVVIAGDMRRTTADPAQNSASR